MNPNVYYAPLAPVTGPSGFSAIVNTNGTVVISWPVAVNLPANGAGAVTGYTLEIEDYWEGTNYVNFSTNELSYVTGIAGTLAFYMQFPFPLNQPPPSGYVPPPYYALQINYANSSSLWTPFQPSFDPTCTVNGTITRGTEGNLYLAVSSIPSNVMAIRIMFGANGSEYPINNYGFEFATFGDLQWFAPAIPASSNWSLPYFDVPVSSITNGRYQIPLSQVPLFGAYSLNLAGIGTNGNLGTVILASPTNQDNYWTTSDIGPHNFNIPFLDGRTNILQNINMLLRGAGGLNPFNLGLYTIDADGDPQGDYGISMFSNYVWSGFGFIGNANYWNGSGWTYTNYLQRNEFEPFEETTLYTNLIFSSNPQIYTGLDYYGSVQPV